MREIEIGKWRKAGSHDGGVGGSGECAKYGLNSRPRIGAGRNKEQLTFATNSSPPPSLRPWFPEESQGEEGEREGRGERGEGRREVSVS